MVVGLLFSVRAQGWVWLGQGLAWFAGLPLYWASESEVSGCQDFQGFQDFGD
jgi:hypothetical protein